MAELNREEVYKVLDTEREYQIEMSRSDDRPDVIIQLSVGETIAAMQEYLDQARTAWCHNSAPHKDAMDKLRKVGGLVVQAAENYGMPKRTLK